MENQKTMEERVKGWLEVMAAGGEDAEMEREYASDPEFRTSARIGAALTYARNHPEWALLDMDDLNGEITPEARLEFEAVLARGNRPQRSFVRRWVLPLGIAASLLLVVGLVLMFSSRSEQPQVAQYVPLIPHDGLHVSGSSPDQPWDLYQAAVKDFEAGVLSGCMEKLRSLEDTYPMQTDILSYTDLLLGVCLQKSGDLKGSLEKLASAQAVGGDTTLIHTALYYESAVAAELGENASALDGFRSLKQKASKDFLVKYKIEQWINYLD